MTDPAFDRAIDDAARRLTAQAPPADLRARVMARIHDRAEPRRLWRFAPIAAGVAVVAVIGFALTIFRMTPDRRAAVPPAIAPAVPAAGAPVIGPAATVPAIATAAPASTASTAKSSTKASAQPTDAELAWLARAVPALEPPSALGVDAIQPEALTIHQIDVQPLVTEPLAVPPGEGGGVKR